MSFVVIGVILKEQVFHIPPAEFSNATIARGLLGKYYNTPDRSETQTAGQIYPNQYQN